MVLPLLAAGAAWFGVPAVLNVIGFGGAGIAGGSIAALVQVHFNTIMTIRFLLY